MIKIERVERPNELTDEYVDCKTTDYLTDNNKRVWKLPSIKEKLLEMTNNKCAYCESRIELSGSYMEVEHFYPKSIYPQLVLDWDNLLPCCKTCNLKKGDTDPNDFNLINPTEEDPKNHLILKRYSIFGETEKGKNTVLKLHLNDMDKMVIIRARLGEEMINKLSIIKDQVSEVESYYDEGKITLIRNSIIDLLELVQPSKPYSAVLSSLLKNDNHYLEIKEFLVKYNLWNDGMVNLEAQAEQIALFQS